jgi:ankyrin repeat protein
VPSQQQSLTTQVGFNHAVSKVNNLMPEQFDGENAGRVKALTGADPLEAKMQEFQLFAYQLSNNLIEDEDDEYIDEDGKYTKIINIFRGIDLPRPVWKDLIVKSLEQPTGRAFTEALFAAAVNTRTLDICEALLEAGADPDKIIWTWAAANLARPIQLAMDCRVRDVDLARLLIRFGAGVDLVTEDDPDTALQKAAKECTFEAVRVLVEAGASIVDAIWDKRCLTPDTALTNAVDADWRMSHIRDEAEEDELEKSGRVRHGLQTLKYLLTLYDRERHHEIIQNGLIRAASGDRRDMIMDLVQAGAGVNEASSRGYTPLIAAAASSYEGSGARMVKMLLDLGADVDRAFRHSGICAIHIAAAKGDEKVIRLLIDRGADVNAPARHHTSRDRSLLDSHFDRDGMAADTLREMNACQRPLQFALFKDKAKESNYSQKGGRAALALIRAGATLEGGELARAGCFDDVGFLRELLSRGADVNEVDGTGRSALQACLELGNFNLVGCLLESGATVRKGQLFSAAKGGRRDIVETLLNHGAVTDERDAECSVLEAAASSKNWELMVWLMETHDVPYDEGALCAAICSGLGSSKENEKYLLSLQKRRTNDTKGGTLEATALGYAAFHRQEWVLQHLLQLKTKGPCIIPVKDDEGYQHLAQVHPRVMSWAYEEPFWRHPAMARCSVLVPALLRHDWRTVRRLLRAGHQPDRLSLLVAIEGQSLKAIASLAKRMDKLDICQPARSNLDTPLQAAVRHRRVGVAQYLLSLGANVNAQASGRLIVREDWSEPLLPRTALQAAVENGHVEMMDLLLDAGPTSTAPPGGTLAPRRCRSRRGGDILASRGGCWAWGRTSTPKERFGAEERRWRPQRKGEGWTWCSFWWRRGQGWAVVWLTGGSTGGRWSWRGRGGMMRLCGC